MNEPQCTLPVMSSPRLGMFGDGVHCIACGHPAAAHPIKSGRVRPPSTVPLNDHNPQTCAVCKAIALSPCIKLGED